MIGFRWRECNPRVRWRFWSGVLFGGLVMLLVAEGALGDGTDPQQAAALRARHAALSEQLARNAYQMPLFLESVEGGQRLQGDVYGVVPHAFGAVEHSLGDTAQWCGVLILHLNVKYCRPAEGGLGGLLTVYAGRKFYQSLSDAYRLDYAIRVAADTPDYLRVLLTADTGPMGTKDYRILLEAVPLDRGTTFIHLSYAYGFGMMAKLSMQAYLETLGRGKIGFTPAAAQSGVRAAVERNAMRYYLALLAFLGAARPDQVEPRLHEWFSLTERFARQLHEVERDEYLKMKRAEIKRAQGASGR